MCCGLAPGVAGNPGQNQQHAGRKSAGMSLGRGVVYVLLRIVLVSSIRYKRRKIRELLIDIGKPWQACWMNLRVCQSKQGGWRSLQQTSRGSDHETDSRTHSTRINTYTCAILDSAVRPGSIGQFCSEERQRPGLSSAYARCSGQSCWRWIARSWRCHPRAVCAGA